MAKAKNTDKGAALDIQLKTGCFEDAALVRRAVFMDEQGYENEFDQIDEDPGCIHVTLYVDGQLTGCSRVFPEELERAAKARIEAQERESAARTAQREAEVNARLAEKEAALERLLCGAADRIGGADGDLQAMAVSVQDEVAALSQKLAVLTAALAETSAELKKLKA